MGRFDAVLVVDWSAASTPKLGRDSIWSAWSCADAPTEVINHPTRRSFEAWLVARLAGFPGRVLAGFDFSFGYPAGTAAAVRARGVPAWSATWALLSSMLHDDERNVNDRFTAAERLNALIGHGPGPFWGAPPSAVSPSLSATKAPGFPHGGLAEYRRCEAVLRAAGQRVQSSWQLLGAGSVGSQSLTGIPVLDRLRRSSPRPVGVWPFTTGLGLPPLEPDAVVLAEVWPGLVDVDLGRHPVRDAAQVMAVSECLVALDALGELEGWFSPVVDAADRSIVVEEEGWILGAAVPDPSA